METNAPRDLTYCGPKSAAGEVNDTRIVTTENGAKYHVEHRLSALDSPACMPNRDIDPNGPETVAKAEDQGLTHCEYCFPEEADQ